MEIMNNDEQPRSIRFPMSLWDAIDRDAIRCKRSAVKQLQALLLTYYNLEDVELNKVELEKTRNLRQGDSPKVNENAKPDIKKKVG